MSLAYNIFMDTLTAPFKMSPNQYSCITSPNNIPRLQIRGVSSTITVKMGFPANSKRVKKVLKMHFFHSYPVGWRTCCTCTTSWGSCSRRRWVSWPCRWPRKGRKTSCLQFFNYCSSMSTRCFFIVSTHICHDCPGTDEWSGCFHDVPTGQEAIASAATVEAEHWDANRKRHWNKVSNTSNWQIKSPHCCNGQVVGND